MLGGKNVNEPYIRCKRSSFLKENFSQTIPYIALKFSEINEIVILFQYSDILFY